MYLEVAVAEVFFLSQVCSDQPMSFFASRKTGKSGSSSSRSATSTTLIQTVKKPVASTSSSSDKVANDSSSNAISKTSATTSGNGGAVAAGTKLVTVTRKLKPDDKPISLKEHQKQARAKREAEEEQLRRRAALAAQRQREADETAERRRKMLSKGKARADSPKKLSVDESTSSDGGEGDSEADESGELGTPVTERKQPLRVLRDDITAPRDNLREFAIISGVQLVESNKKAYSPCTANIQH